ncbi:hypothetical protein APSETT444_001467 [Aspergillus pseudonomiae]
MVQQQQQLKEEERHTGDTVTPPRETGTFRAPGHKTQQEDETYREPTLPDLTEVTHAPVHQGSLDPEILHPDRHDPTQDGAVLSLGLLDHSYGSRLGKVDPVRPGGEAMGLSRLGRRHGV